jgi:hypothetical protein
MRGRRADAVDRDQPHPALFPTRIHVNFPRRKICFCAHQRRSLRSKQTVAASPASRRHFAATDAHSVLYEVGAPSRTGAVAGLSEPLMQQPHRVPSILILCARRCARPQAATATVVVSRVGSATKTYGCQGCGQIGQYLSSIRAIHRTKSR